MPVRTNCNINIITAMIFACARSQRLRQTTSSFQRTATHHNQISTTRRILLRGHTTKPCCASLEPTSFPAFSRTSWKSMKTVSRVQFWLFALHMHNRCKHRHIQRFHIECFFRHFGRLSSAILQKSRPTDVQISLIAPTWTSVHTPSIKLCKISNPDYQSNNLSAGTSAPLI